MEQKIEEHIRFRGRDLATKQFIGLQKEMLKSLYQHMISKEDLIKEV